MSNDKAMEALLAIQVHRELKQEHFRQCDLGWENSPGFEHVDYQSVVHARTRAARLISEALGIELDFTVKRPDLAPERTKGRKSLIKKENYWIVQRRSLTRIPEDIDMPHG